MSDRADIAVHLYEPGDGGLDRVAILLANGFARRGLKTELWLTRETGKVAGLIAGDMRTRIIAAPKGARGPTLVAQIPALRRMVARHRPKLLLSAGNQANMVVALACRGSGTVPIAKITNPVDRPGVTGMSLRYRRLRFGLTARLNRLTLTLSEADAAEMRRRYRRASFAAVHNPYVTDAMLAAGARSRPRAAMPHIVTIGRLAEQKDQATLIEALARLSARSWRATIVGEGPLKDMLVQRVGALGLAGRVSFAGFVPDPLPYLADADLFVLPSRWEGLPAAPIEAMACGCPVVATDCAPGLAEVMAAARQPPPIPVGDPAALAAAIAAALERPADRAALRTAALPYSLEASIDDHLRLFAPYLG